MRYLARGAGIVIGVVGIVSGVVAQVGHRKWVR
jgi:hypothetical protein